MRTLKLMSDYECFPLWETDNNGLKNIDPNKLPISKKLKQDLYAWSKKYDNTLNYEDPMNSGFQSKESEQTFRLKGANLHKRLQEELGEKFEVHLFKDEQS